MTDTLAGTAGFGAGRDIATVATTVGAVSVGAALFEVALLPGIVIGAAALLAPDLLGKRLPGLRRALQSPFGAALTPRSSRSAPPDAQDAAFAPSILRHLRISEAVAKTITFRLTVATLDFTWNFAVLGELGTAAGLSALNLGVGPFFYFVHEAAWNYWTAPGRTGLGRPTAGISVLQGDASDDAAPLINIRGWKVTRATAKTIVYETLGATSEFSVNLVVVQDLATAAILTAPLVIFGPIVYYSHERLWERFGNRKRGPAAPL